MNVPPCCRLYRLGTRSGLASLVVVPASTRLTFARVRASSGPVAESEHATTNAIPNEAPAASAAFRFMRMSCLPSLVLVVDLQPTALKKNVPQRVA